MLNYGQQSHFPQANRNYKTTQTKKAKSHTNNDGMGQLMQSPSSHKEIKTVLVCDCFLRKKTGRMDLRRI
jgi:hypothetical protein